MKRFTVSLTILCLTLAAVPAFADYSNGSINGTTDAWTLNFGYIVSDTFVADSTTVTGFMFGVWEFPGDTLSSVDWSITSGENSGTIYGSGTASGASLSDASISTNQFGYNIDEITVSGLNVGVINGGTYWLNLQNAAVPSGDPVYWDENSGPSSASESALGTIPSEAFTLNTQIHGCSGDGVDCIPEPSSMTLFGTGLLALLGVLRCKLRL